MRLPPAVLSTTRTPAKKGPSVCAYAPSTSPCWCPVDSPPSRLTERPPAMSYQRQRPPTGSVALVDRPSRGAVLPEEAWSTSLEHQRLPPDVHSTIVITTGLASYHDHTWTHELTRTLTSGPVTTDERHDWTCPCLYIYNMVNPTACAVRDWVRRVFLHQHATYRIRDKPHCHLANHLRSSMSPCRHLPNTG